MTETWIKSAEYRINVFLDYCYELPALYDHIYQIQSELNKYGVNSPKIISQEEAKYQKGTMVYTDAALLEKIEVRDSLIKDYLYKDWYCLKIQKFLETLPPEDVELLSMRYERRCTLRQIADIYYSNKDSVQKKIQEIIVRF